MKKILLSLTALAVLTVLSASPALAAPKGGQGGKHVTMNKSYSPHMNKTNFHSNHNYHLSKGTKFAHGYFYKGKNHSHWSHRRFDSRYGCECYWDGGCDCWFYYCQPDDCYYPVSYCPYRRYCWTPVVVRRVVLVTTVPCTTCNQVVPVATVPCTTCNQVAPGPLVTQASTEPPLPEPLAPLAQQ